MPNYSYCHTLKNEPELTKRIIAQDIIGEILEVYSDIEELVEETED